jgi:protein-S-isoprenylcysteine O-methyltransferase Ste14
VKEWFLNDWYRLSLWAWIGVGVIVMPIVFLRTAPYGRHTPADSKWTLPSRLGWILMEAPSSIIPIVLFILNPSWNPVTLLLLLLWQLHYGNRAWVYPFRIRGGEKPMPVGIMLGAFFFTSVNGFFNGWHVTHTDWSTWASDPRFALGVALFCFGFFINQQSDQILFNLRKPGETGYKIPRGGLYRFVSCPNYFGEILEWTGWAVATWSLAGLSFVVWTLANLLPRAIQNHKWYREKFSDYPRERRALIPFIL